MIWQLPYLPRGDECVGDAPRFAIALAALRNLINVSG